MGTDANQAILIEVLGGFLADIRDVRGQLLLTPFRVAHLQAVLRHVQRSEHILANNAIGDHDGVLKVVSLPWHEGHLHVLTEGELTGLGGVTLHQDVSLLDAHAFAHNGLQVDARALVGLGKLGDVVDFHVVFEGHQAVILIHLVADVDFVAIHVFHHTVSLCRDQHSAVAGHLSFQTSSNDGAVGAHQWHRLTHHVGSHQRPVGVVVLEERNEGRRDGGDLVGCYVDVLDLLWRHQREVALKARLDDVVLEGAVVVEAHRRLRDDGAILFLGAQVLDAIAARRGHALIDFAVRRLNEAEAVDLGVHAQAADQTDVWTFRRLNRAEATVVRVVHVSDLKARALTGQTSGTECRDAALVRHLAQRVRLVHELAQLVRSEERVDHRAQRLGVDQVGRGEHLVVAHVHALPDGPGHPGEAHAELVVELLAHRADAAVGEVVDVVHIRLRIHEVDEELDDEDDVVLGQRAGLLGHVDAELPVDAETAHFTQVVTLLGEEQLVDHAARRVHVWRLCVPELAVDVFHSLLLRVGRVLLQRVVDDGVVGLVDVLLVQDDGLRTGLHDELDVLLFQHRIAVEHQLVPLDAHHFTGVLIHEVLDPRLQHTGCEAASQHALHTGLGDLDLFGQVENAQNVPVGLISDGTKQRGDRKLLLPVDVRIHHAVDVGRKFNPAALERDDPRAIQLGAIGMAALAEEHARRTVQLVDNDALRPVDHEGPTRGHVRNGAQVDVLDNGLEILVLRIGAVQLQLRLQRHTVRQATLDAFFDAVTWRVDEVVQEFENELVPRIGDRKVLVEHLEESLGIPVLRLGFQLEKLAERAKLDVEKVRVGEVRCGAGERVSLLQLGSQHGCGCWEGVKSQTCRWVLGDVPSVWGTRRSDRDLRPA